MANEKQSFTLEGAVSGITDRGFYLGHGAPKWSSDRDVFIPRREILDSDTDLDEIEIGDQIAIEIPMWLARDRGLV